MERIISPCYHPLGDDPRLVLRIRYTLQLGTMAGHVVRRADAKPLKRHEAANRKEVVEPQDEVRPGFAGSGEALERGVHAKALDAFEISVGVSAALRLAEETFLMSKGSDPSV